MELKVHCPGCGMSLRVPQGSAGRGARCPTCGRKFVIPRMRELVEETFCTWIEEEFDKHAADREDKLTKSRPPDETPAAAERARPAAQSPYPDAIFRGQGTRKGGPPASRGNGHAEPPAPPESPAATAEPPADTRAAAALARPVPTPQPHAGSHAPAHPASPPAAASRTASPRPQPQPHPQPATPRREDEDDDVLSPEAIDLGEPLSPASPADARPSPRQAAAHAQTVRGHDGAAESVTADAGVATLSPVLPPAPAKPKPAATLAGSIDPPSAATVVALSAAHAVVDVAPEAHAAGLDFPANLHVVKPIPHLAVAGCTQEGVRLAFDSIWLEHPGFRLSLPVRSVFTGEADPANLVARPLAFIDRSQAAVRSAREVEARYERNLAGTSPKEVLSVMGLLDGPPKPFNSPVLYYVDTHQTRLSLACSTRARPDGGVTCEVLVPEGRYALDWLARVNGVCGAEYGLLEKAVGRLGSDAWRKLSDEARQRLGAWCEFQPMESLRLYLSDADFARRDLGLAGVAVTDRRLIYCKFHRRGQTMLDQPAVLQAVTEGDFVNLQLVNDEGRAKVAKLHRSDLPALAEALNESKGLRLESKVMVGA